VNRCALLTLSWDTTRPASKQQFNSRLFKWHRLYKSFLTREEWRVELLPFTEPVSITYKCYK
jgi:hypothetical protein